MYIIALKRRRIFAIAITCIVGWICAYLATNVFRDYALGLFIWLPMVMGIITTLILGMNSPVSRQDLCYTSMGALGVFCVGMLGFAWEGIICLLMAAPIGLFFNFIGHRIGYYIIKNKRHKNIPTVCTLLFLSVPALMAFENKVGYTEETRSVTTSIEINAPIEQVWSNIIQFPKMEEPTELIFKTGIAYPTSAQIDGRGVGAVRHCNFSTGSFVEPITEWKEPTLLKFDVAEQPEPMKELSLYDIHPNHLHGYWVSQKGEFKLTQLPNGHTLVEGTTWYINRIRPDFYWTIWSDYIVHKIHQRVLEHIKKNSEKDVAQNNL
ncbi:MAG TPA: SRPBCC family protein [Bacteroidia bacterium]|jgi:hypothetical protein|nr:SRPBCC family protein [Bacteroidia bacterium]